LSTTSPPLDGVDGGGKEAEAGGVGLGDQDSHLLVLALELEHHLGEAGAEGGGDALQGLVQQEEARGSPAP
jgi:hypothetical protein